MIDERKYIDQLCYSWSTIGVDGAVAGSRVRAASAGLSQLAPYRMQKLVPFESYKLPLNVDPLSVDPLGLPTDRAPICLSLFSTDEERVIAQKVYAGKDGIGRQGAFFAHFFVGLPGPHAFSPLDAIKLWRSPVFLHSESQLDPNSTELKPVEFSTLLKSRQPLQPSEATREKTRRYFPYIVQAYLTKTLIPKRNSPLLTRQPLYVVADDADIAYFIFGLIYCLPPQLVKDITFSTYEHNLAEPLIEIVGTCWPSNFDGDQQAKNPFSPQDYQPGGKLAVNCYAELWSPLENNPLVMYDPRAADFAKDALAYLIEGRVTGFDFKRFLDETSRIPDEQLDIPTFLNLYDNKRRPPIPSPRSLLKDFAHSRDLEVISNFIRQPIPLEHKHIEVTDSLKRLNATPGVSQEIIIRIMDDLSASYAYCIENSAQLVSVVSVMIGVFPSTQDLFQFLYAMAQNIQKGVKERRYPPERIFIYYELAFSFKTVFFEPHFAEFRTPFVQRLAKILFQDMDNTNISWFVDKALRSEYWYEIVEQRRRYESWLNSIPPQSLATELPEHLPINGERMEKEHKVAFAALEKALDKGKIERIKLVMTDHRAVFSAHDTEIPPEWWSTIDAAFEFSNACEEADAQDREDTREQWEIAIVAAFVKIRNLPNTKCPPLKLTEYEKKRYNTARDFLAALDKMHEEQNRQQRAVVQSGNAIVSISKEHTTQTRPSTNLIGRFFRWLRL